MVEPPVRFRPRGRATSPDTRRPMAAFTGRKQALHDRPTGSPLFHRRPGGGGLRLKA
jgi:hypothetical protein